MQVHVTILSRDKTNKNVWSRGRLIAGPCKETDDSYLKTLNSLKGFSKTLIFYLAPMLLIAKCNRCLFFFLMCCVKLDYSEAHFGKLPKQCEVSIPSGWYQVAFKILYNLLEWRSHCFQKPWCSWTHSYYVVTWSSPLKGPPKQSHGVFWVLIRLLVHPMQYI